MKTMSTNRFLYKYAKRYEIERLPGETNDLLRSRLINKITQIQTREDNTMKTTSLVIDSIQCLEYVVIKLINESIGFSVNPQHNKFNENCDIRVAIEDEEVLNKIVDKYNPDYDLDSD